MKNVGLKLSYTFCPFKFYVSPSIQEKLIGKFGLFRFHGECILKSALEIAQNILHLS